MAGAVSYALGMAEKELITSGIVNEKGRAIFVCAVMFGAIDKLVKHHENDRNAQNP